MPKSLRHPYCTTEKAGSHQEKCVALVARVGFGEVNHYIVGQPVPRIAVGDFGSRDARFCFLRDETAGWRAGDRLQATYL